MSVKIIIQHVCSGIVFLTGLIFCILKMCNVNLTVNEADINSLIFGLGAFIAACIEIIPFIIQTLKDKNFSKIMSIVNDVVYAVEELKDLSGVEKKTRAMAIITMVCIEKGLNIDNVDISNMIESVITLYNRVVK